MCLIFKGNQVPSSSYTNTVIIVISCSNVIIIPVVSVGHQGAFNMLFGSNFFTAGRRVFEVR